MCKWMLTLSGPHLRPVPSFPRSTLASPLRCVPPDSLGKALQPFLEHQHCACALDTVSHFIVIDSELSWSKSPFYIWERDCFKKIAHKTLHMGAGETPLWLMCCQSKCEDMGLNPRTRLKSGQSLTSLWSQYTYQWEGQRQETPPKKKHSNYPGIHSDRQQKRGPNLK